MLPNDPQLAFDQAMATMAERQHQAGQERLVASRSRTDDRAVSSWRSRLREIRALAARVSVALGGHRRAPASAADDAPGTAVS